MKTALIVAGVLTAALGPPILPASSSYTQSAHPNGAQALDALATVERRFAAAARERGWRAAFLEYFAEDSIALTPDPVSARDRWKIRPLRPSSEEELTWEPKAGDIATSGEIGWLTGPSTFLDHTAAQSKPGYGNYLSIWKRQPDGRWRVFLDVGTTVPAPVSFPTWFTHVTAVPRFHLRTSGPAATSDLLEADRRFNDRLRNGNPASVYLALVVEHGRLHRAATTPTIAVGVDQIKQWFTANPVTMKATSTACEAAASGDLGYVYGTYEFGGAIQQHGAYVRIWSRAADGEWRIAADVTAPAA